jgi:hypothetical protein
MSRRSSALLAALIGLLVLTLGPATASAGLSAAQIQAALDADSGWRMHKEDAKGGVDVFIKDIDGLEVPGFKGTKVVDVSSDKLFDAIVDIANQAGISEDIPLKQSHILAASATQIDFWQYLDVPGWTFANDRFWFCRGKIFRDFGGPGHHKWTWDKLEGSSFPAALAKAKAIDEDAVETSLNHGSWEVIPQGGGKTLLIYRVVSNPGGKLPKSAQKLATGTTLPDNLLQFEAWAKKR